AGQVWTASINADPVRLGATGSIQVTLQIQCLDSNGDTVPNGPSTTTTLNSEASQVVSLSFTAPNSAASLSMQVVASNPVGGVEIQFSSPVLAQGIQPGLGNFFVSFTPQGNSTSLSPFCNVPIECPVPGCQFSYMLIEGS